MELGGAYHLCSHPKEALAIANKTIYIGMNILSDMLFLFYSIYNYSNILILGCMLQSEKIIIKGKIYQAVNYCLMGK